MCIWETRSGDMYIENLKYFNCTIFLQVILMHYIERLNQISAFTEASLILVINVHQWTMWCPRQWGSDCSTIIEYDMWLDGKSRLCWGSLHPIQRQTHICLCMMTSSNGNILRVTGLLCGEFIADRRIPRIKANDAELWCFLWSAPEPTVE